MRWQYVIALLLIGAVIALVTMNEYIHVKHPYDITQEVDYAEVMAGLPGEH